MDQPNTIQEILFYALFSSTATIALIAGLYLLLRRSNAIAPEINSPLRLRRWTAAFFVVTVISHLCWLLFRYEPSADIFNGTILCIAIDAVTTLPAILCTMLVMLQDRRRPLWPVAIVEALALAGVLLIYLHGGISLLVILMYALVFLCVIITMVIAVRQYDRWLRENYSDLEHKEVWQTFLVVAGFMLTTVAYSLANEFVFFEIFIEVIDIAFFAILLWRVETLQTLEEPDDDALAEDTTGDTAPVTDKLSTLLQQYCVEEQYYLRHEASLTQLVKLMGTNRNYLSQHFAQQGLTYNTYINGLRIAHFKRLYQASIQSSHTVNASDIAVQCGFSSYRTFSRSFNQATGQSVTEWMQSLMGDERRARF